MRNTADVTGGKPITVLLQCISGVSAINPLINYNFSYILFRNTLLIGENVLTGNLLTSNRLLISTGVNILVA
jgi:hypothetical protein